MTKARAFMAGGLNNPSVYDRAAGGLAVSQLITDFGRTANLTASSKFQAQAENQNANATREQVLLQVNVSYFGTLEAQAVLQVAQQTVDTRQLLLDQVSLLASNKMQVGTGREFCAASPFRKANCCCKRRRTTPTPRWPRFPRRWAIVNPRSFNSSSHRRPSLPTRTTFPNWSKRRWRNGRNY